MRLVNFLTLSLIFSLNVWAVSEAQTSSSQEFIEGSANQSFSPPLVEWGRVGLGLTELVITIVLGFLVVLFSHKALMWALSFQIKDLKKDTLSAGLLSASTIVGMSIITRTLLYPIFSLLGRQVSLPDSSNQLFLTIIFLIMFVVLGFAVALGTLFLALRVFDLLTKNIKEIEEIQKGNITVALILSAVIVALSLFISDGLSSLLVSLLPGLQVKLL
jgi:uncharacterized membrane protein YjfL (UPF0719 family)